MVAAMLLTFIITAAGLCIGTVVLAHADTGRQMAVQEKDSQNLPPVYQRWVDEDVLWIITPEERSTYLKLAGNSERDAFIKQFWERRNPTPGAAENTFKQEHYRRIAYANEHYAADVPGWRTDRGRIFILYGKPVSIEVHPLGDEHSAKAYETWHYRSKDMKFVDDDCNCGDYRLQALAKE
jgi:GWxTD domain-containing protein